MVGIAKSTLRVTNSKNRTLCESCVVVLYNVVDYVALKSWIRVAMEEEQGAGLGGRSPGLDQTSAQTRGGEQMRYALFVRARLLNTECSSPQETDLVDPIMLQWSAVRTEKARTS